MQQKTFELIKTICKYHNSIKHRCSAGKNFGGECENTLCPFVKQIKNNQNEERK